MNDFYLNFTNYIFENHRDLYNEAVEAIKKPVEKRSSTEGLSIVERMLKLDMDKSRRNIEEEEFLASSEAEDFYNEIINIINGSGN